MPVCTWPNRPTEFIVDRQVSVRWGRPTTRRKAELMSNDETQEPTLRKGDSSGDGWVEYLQELLTLWLDANGYATLTRDGVFGEDTHNAVLWFQEVKGLLVDGVVGNQTWAALRSEDPQPIGTDGRTPGTFVDAGVEARWILDDNSARYDRANDLLFLVAMNTGTEVINGSNFMASGTVTTADAQSKELVVYLTGESGVSEAPSGERFYLVITNASAEYGTGEIHIDLTMSNELGGDRLETTMTIEGP